MDDDPKLSWDTASIGAWSADIVSHSPVLQDLVAPMDDAAAAAEHSDMSAGANSLDQASIANLEQTVDNYRSDIRHLINNINIFWSRCLALDAQLADIRGALHDQQDISLNLAHTIGLMTAERSAADFLANAIATAADKLAADIRGPGVNVSEVEMLLSLVSELKHFTFKRRNECDRDVNDHSR